MARSESTLDRNKFRIAFVLLLVGFISAVFVAMIRQFLMTILVAAIFTGLFRPLNNALLGVFKGHKAWASAGTLFVLVVAVAGPFLFFVGVLVSQAISVTQMIGPWMDRVINQPDGIARLLESTPLLEKLAPYRAEILTRLGAVVGDVGNFLINGLSATTRGTISFLFQFFILIYTMFYFFMDGDRLLQRILHYVPLSHEDEERMMGKFVSVTRATLKGTLVIGILQGSLAGIAIALVGVPSPVFWATIMVVLSIIPAVGTGLVWGPVAVYQLATGHIVSGVFLLVFCGLIVGSIDNLLRPRIVGRDVQMHDLLILFGTLGGIFLFGVIGFIIGPILAALFVTIWEIYGIVFKDALPAVAPPAAQPLQDEETNND